MSFYASYKIHLIFIKMDDGTSGGKQQEFEQLLHSLREHRKRLDMLLVLSADWRL